MTHVYIVRTDIEEKIFRFTDKRAERKLANIHEMWNVIEVKKVENMTQEQRTEFCKDMMKLFTIDEIYDFYKARITCDAKKEKQVREICEKHGAVIKPLAYVNNAYDDEPDEWLFVFDVLNYGV